MADVQPSVIPPDRRGSPRRSRPPHHRPSLRSLSLSNLPAFLSPFPLPSHLSALLHLLCSSNDSTLSSLLSSLKERQLDVDQWERAVWCYTATHLQPHYDVVFHSLDMSEVETAVAKERAQRGWLSDVSLTFGEVPLSSFACILARHVPLSAADQCFVDLGSGLGRGVVAAALCHSFSSILGIEILHCLHSTAVSLLHRLTPSSLCPESTVRVVCDDLLENKEWRCADVVFVNSTCFGVELMKRLSEKCEELRLGSRVITLTRPLSSTHFLVKDVGWYPMSWGAADVFVHCKVHPSSVV